MADLTVDALGELASPAANDEIGIWDVSAGQYLKIQRSVLIGATLTGAGTIATGGFTATVPETGIVAMPGTRNQFAVAQGLVASKTSVASGSATGICTLVSGGGGALMFALLVSVEASGSGLSSGGLWAVTGGYSTIAATAIAQSLYGHSALTLAASIVAGTRTITLTVTQTNAGAGACTVRIGVFPLASAVDGALTITAL